ncbi:sulfotransferase 1E1-like [Saccostrea echinata]|uniref:sulfotransferase 1E1-like n=1 Tax=Saccostrea echinata TaxID=191078 RepID=UPI002A836F82|nr:sulfotransferase 1E1-like [Saccostrea echinata]
MMEAGDRNISQRFVVFDGMHLPPFVPLMKDAKKRFEEIRDMECRKDDVIIAAYSKSGTHWIWEIVCMLLKGRAEYAKETKEFLFLEAIPDMSVVHNLASPRPLNTHFPYRWLPKQHVQNGGKIVHIIRNPKDVAVSLYHQLLQSGLFNDFNFKTFLDQMFLGPACPFGTWFKYEREFEEAEKNDKFGSIHTIHYENMKKNPEEETRKLAQFLEVNTTEELIAEIVDKCSFDKLKQIDSSFKDQSHLKRVIGAEGIKVPDIYRKGKIGDWKNHFTVALNEQFDDIFKEEMKDSSIQVQFE